MQLDKTYIAVRERGFMEILDLSLHVVTRFAGPLALALLAGILPLAIATHLLAADAGALEEDLAWNADYTALVCVLAALAAPLAGAPATLLLGQSLFMERPSARRISRDLLSSLPQLIWFQVVMRGALIFFVFTSFVPFVFQPYVGEIVLLERNPLFQGRRRRHDSARQITTMMRVRLLHKGSGGELFGRWITSMAAGSIMAAMILLALTGCMQWISGNGELDRTTYAIFVQIAVWVTVGFFTVVRFLSYLDLRIRREGWEVELKMRAEATRLQGELV